MQRLGELLDRESPGEHGYNTHCWTGPLLIDWMGKEFDEVIKAIRRSIKPDGVWIIKDIRCSHDMEENLENPMSPLFYGISVLYCMSAALSEPNGAGLGTMDFNPKIAEKMTREGGFRNFEQLEIEEDLFNNFYAAYPG